MHNLNTELDPEQIKKNIRLLLLEQALVLKPEPVWPGFNYSASNSDFDLYTEWINTWYNPLVLSKSAEQLQISLPNPFFTVPFHKHVLEFFKITISKINLELLINNYPFAQQPVKLEQPALLGQYTGNSSFDSFLINSKNEYTLKTLRKFCAAELNINQIFLRGPSGSGKTHLLNAVLDAFQVKPNVSCRYLGYADFLDLLQPNFRQSQIKKLLEHSSCLALDDLHLLDRDKTAQTALVQIMDACALRKLPLLMSALLDPAMEDPSPNFTPELKSRLSQGLILFLQEPDLDIRLRYAKQLFSEKNLPQPQEFMLNLARKCSNLRQLQGLSEQISLFWAHTGQLPDEHYLGNMLRSSGSGDSLNADAVLAIVAAKYGFQPRDLRGDKRRPDLVQARQIAMFLCRELLGESYPNLGKIFGGKDHSTVMYAVKKIRKMQLTNKEMNILLAQLTSECSKYGN